MAIIGCGYVGASVARYWQERGHLVTVTTTTTARVTELEKVAARVVVMDGTDALSVQSVVQNQQIVLLSVAPKGGRYVPAEIYEQTYLTTARNLAIALSNTPTVKQLIYLGSCSVYGNKNGEWVDETATLVPENEYDRVLCSTERVLLQAVPGCCILRLGIIYGPDREFTKRLEPMAGKTIPGSGENFAPWTHLDDIVGGVEFACQHGLNGIYNLVNDVRLTIGEIAHMLCDRHNLPQVSWDATKPSVQDLNARVNNHKIKAAGYELMHPDTIV